MACDSKPQPDPVEGRCVVRRFHPDDAPEVVRLVQAIYGDTYYPPDLYDPGQVVRDNESGRLVSVVSADDAAIVGHYALELHECGTVAEASDAIVAVEYRHHHLMEEMRGRLHDEAERIGLLGLVGYPVTNHLYSQMAEERFGAHPCGVALGLWPESFHNMPQGMPQRMSFVIYFKYLRPEVATLHAATPHDAILNRIAEQWRLPIRVPPSAPLPAIGQVSIEQEPEVQTGTIRVLRTAADTLSVIRQARRSLQSAGARAILLELPLAQAAISALCVECERDGFFFCGLGPAFLTDGDALLLQWISDAIDPAIVQVHSPFAHELLAYVAGKKPSTG